MESKEFFKFKEGTQEAVVEGGLCVIEKIFYFLFKSPFVLWRMSCEHLKQIRNEAKLDIEKIDKPIPYIIFLIRYFFDFLFHALIVISVVISPIAAIIATIVGIIDSTNYTASDFFSDFLGTFVAFYYAPVAIRLLIETFVIIKKYGLVILRYIFFPVVIIYYFFYYLAKKCKFKTAKYEKKLIDINKEQPMDL